MDLNEIKLAAPFIILSLGSFLLLLIEVFKKGPWPRASIAIFTVLAAIVAGYKKEVGFEVGKTIFNGVMYADPLSWYFTMLILGGALLTLLFSYEQLPSENVDSPSEFYSLLLMATAGAILFVSSAEFITLFLGLEIMSMALYCLCGSALTVRASSESALKYFLLGSFSSAFLLYGFAFVYGMTGSFNIVEIAQRIPQANPIAMRFAVGLILVGLVFKLGAVPFHFWAPDVYQGAPTPVTGFMACVVKASAVGVILRVLWQGFPDAAQMFFWGHVLWLVAVLTMVVANLIAVRQKNVKRMLAYSSIAHAGYLTITVSYS